MDCSRRRGSAEEEEEEEQGGEGIAGAGALSDGEGDSSDGSASMGMARWLGVLELQTMGACRADERSSLPSLPCLLSLPLLRLSLSLSLSLTSSAHPSLGIFGPAAQDRLLAHLTQLFDASEIGLLVRCLCAPLVSIRVGKVNRLSSLLCPIPYRGQLNLNMAPASRLQISFVGDDGRTEQLCSISCNSSEVDSIIIEEIVADASGRSFVVKVSESQVFYYWLSEKSLSHGIHLLGKMKDILRRRPTLSDLTGISNSRLDSLGSHLKACLVSPNLSVAQSIPSESTASTSTSTFTFTSSENALRKHHTSTLTHDGSSSSSSSSSSCFKDNSSQSSARTVGGIRDNMLEGHHVGPLAIPLFSFNPPSSTQSQSVLPSGSGAVAGLSAGLPPEFSPFNPLTFQFPIPPSDSIDPKRQQPLFKPQYCWCPMGPSRVPSSSALPPLPPLAIPPPIAVAAPSSLSLGLSTTASSHSDCTKVLLHDPLVHLPLPVSSLVIPPLPGSSQFPFPAFTGLMSDHPIVHLPVMDIRSAGQAYLVSAGPAISTAIPPLVVKPLVPPTESVAEKNARETLMRLLESAPMPSPIHAVAFSMDVFSSVNSAVEEDMSCQASEREVNEQEQEVRRVDKIKWDE